jgi:aminoglycoside phosphotransferase family enzyme/predicted kinase
MADFTQKRTGAEEGPMRVSGRGWEGNSVVAEVKSGDGRTGGESMGKTDTRTELHEVTDLSAWLERVERLRQAPVWPEAELPVEKKQTHISVLLLSRNYVVKLKKPVNFGFLDYTTVEKRRKACEDEVRLNRRLCPDTYLRVGRVSEAAGQLRFSEGAGKVVDYCVWMKRLPEERMLDRMVASGAVTETVIDRVAGRLAEFHRGALRGPEIAKWGDLEEIRRNWEENFTQTAPFIGRTIGDADFEAIRSWVGEEVAAKGGLFRSRARDGRVVDGHGDVRCESVCVKDDVICIYDCIEFNDRFRCGDVAGEVAFLAMDLDARGRPDLGYFFTEVYLRRTGDRDLFALLPFYRCYRAFVRGKVLGFRLDEKEFAEEERQAAAARAEGFFNLARRYAAPLKRPTVVAVGGLSGTGKTSLARAVAGELGLRVVSADAVRQSIFGDAKGPTGYGEGAYTPEANRLTYQTMLERGRKFVEEGRGVVLDATFLRREDRAAAERMAAGAGAEWRLIECRLAPEVARKRIDLRAARGEGLSDADWEVYLRQREMGEDLCDGTDVRRRSFDTGGGIAETARGMTDWLRLR